MILYRERTGFVNSAELIRNASVWQQNLFSKAADIMFYPYNPMSVVDISGQGSDIELYHYPHTRKDIVIFCEKKEDIIKKLLEDAKVKYPGREVFSVDLDSECVITDEHFTCWTPSTYFDHNLFIFEGKNINTFPICYSIPREAEKGSYKYVFGAQVFTSHNCMRLAGKATEFGKVFTYILAVSHNRSKFIGDGVPNIQHVDFPTSSRERLPSFLRTDALEKFMDNCGIDKVMQSGKEIPLLTEPKEPEIIGAKSDDEIEIEKKMALSIQKQVLDKSSVSMADLMAYGVDRVLKILPVSDKIIHVDLDIGGMCKKMCIFHGKVHVIPSVQETEWEFYLGADPDYFIECTEETFPTYLN